MQILKYIIEEAKEANINYAIIHREPGLENGTLFSACIQLEGESTPTFTKNWIGTIQWVGKSHFRKHHKRKNWFVAINEINISEVSYSFNDKDFSDQTIRSGGLGGQHVNKVSNAIRAKHNPSGISVVASDSRSQFQNKKLAKEWLLAQLKIEQLNQQKDKIRNEWKNHSEIHTFVANTSRFRFHNELRKLN